MKKDNRQLKVLLIGMMSVIAGVFVFFFLALRKEDLNLQTYIWLGIVLTILIACLVIFISRYKDVKKGIPLEDERSKQVLNMAASRAFYVTLYWLLAISTFEKFFAGLAGLDHLTASQVTGGGIMGMAIAFLGFWLYYNKKGNI